MNDVDMVRGHLLDPHYFHVFQLWHASLRDRAYTAVQSLKYPPPHLCGRADHRKTRDCSVSFLCAMQAIILFPDPRSVLEVTVQLLSRPVFRGDESSAPGSGHVNFLFCSLLQAHLSALHDEP